MFRDEPEGLGERLANAPKELLVLLYIIAGAFWGSFYLYQLITWTGPTGDRAIAIIAGSAGATALFYFIRRYPNQALWGYLEMGVGGAGIVVAAFWRFSEPEQWLGLIANIMIGVDGLNRWRTGRSGRA